MENIGTNEDEKISVLDNQHSNESDEVKENKEPVPKARK